MSEARKPSQTSSHIPQIPASSENSASSTPSPQDGVQKQVRARRRNKKRKRGETNISTTDTPGHTPWLESLGMTEYENNIPVGELDRLHGLIDVHLRHDGDNSTDVRISVVET